MRKIPEPGNRFQSSITINMTDAYDAGWTDNAIEIYEDGVLVATVTLETGTSGV